MIKQNWIALSSAELTDLLLDDSVYKYVKLNTVGIFIQLTPSFQQMLSQVQQCPESKAAEEYGPSSSGCTCLLPPEQGSTLLLHLSVLIRFQWHQSSLAPAVINTLYFVALRVNSVTATIHNPVDSWWFMYNMIWQYSSLKVSPLPLSDKSNTWHHNGKPQNLH